MNNLLNKFSFLILCAIGLSVTSCAKTSSNVNIVGLKNAKNETFMLGTVKIPCTQIKDIPTLPSFYSISDKQHQLELLDSIETGKILEIIAENYGLNISTNQEVELDSYPYHFIGLLGEGGRCWNYEGKSVNENKNVVNIEYTMNYLAAPPVPFKLWSGYKVTVKSNGSTIIKHKGEVATVKRSAFNHFSKKEAFELFKNHAQNIPQSLKKDLGTNIK